MGVEVGVADMESNTREGGPESRLHAAYKVSDHATGQNMQLINQDNIYLLKLVLKIKIQEIKIKFSLFHTMNIV